MEKTRYKLNICGVEIAVSADTDPQAAEQIADTVRSQMQRILGASMGATVEKAAVITAMNFCEELLRKEAQLQKAEQRVAVAEARLQKPAPAAEEASPRVEMRNPFRPQMEDADRFVSFFAKE